MTWDLDLSSFLNTQDHLRDLYLADYVAPAPDNPALDESGSGSLLLSSNNARIRPGSLPMLSTLECSFIDAIQTLVPGRPVVRIKTCFSRDDVRGKTEELRRLSATLRRASARVRSLDLGDASYTEEFSLTVLGALVRYLPDLRYFGTLVLPVGVEVRRVYLVPKNCPTADSPTCSVSLLSLFLIKPTINVYSSCPVPTPLFSRLTSASNSLGSSCAFGLCIPLNWRFPSGNLLQARRQCGH